MDRTPAVAMSVALHPHGDRVSATVTLDGLGAHYEASALAPVSKQQPAAGVEYQLAVSRALSKIQHDLMESVHERIDRTTDDV